MARMLAAKTSLMVRKDALGEEEGDAELGIEVRAKLERRIKTLEEGQVCICPLLIVLWFISLFVDSSYIDCLLYTFCLFVVKCCQSF